MTDIADLQKTVDSTRAAFARASEQHARSRKDAMDLIRIVEDQLRENRIGLSQNKAHRDRITREYGQLRQMLHGLVMDIEVGPAQALQADAAEIEARPDGAAALEPVPAPCEPQEPDAEATNGAVPPPRKPVTRKAKKIEDTKAEAEMSEEDAGTDEIRAGLKRMLKKVRPRNTEPIESQADASEAQAAAE